MADSLLDIRHTGRPRPLQLLLGMESCERLLGRLLRWLHVLQLQQPAGSPVRVELIVSGLWIFDSLILLVSIFSS